MSSIGFALLAFLAFCAVWMVILTPSQINDALDCFVVSGAVAVLIRYGKPFWWALKARRPRPEQILIASICGMCISTGGLRIFRQFGLEMDLISDQVILYSMALITAVMIFSIFLKVIAPPVHGTDSSSPWAAVLFAIVSGSVLYGVLYLGKLIG